MTKLEAIEIINDCVLNHFNKAIDIEQFEAVGIAIECIQHCLDEEDSPCYNCYDKHCNNCLYSGRIPE